MTLSRTHKSVLHFQRQLDSCTNVSIYIHFLWLWVNILNYTDLNLNFCCTIQLHEITGDICSSKQAVKSNQLSHKHVHTSQLLLFSNRASFRMSPVSVIKLRILDILKSWEKVLKDTSILNGCVVSTNAKWIYVSCCMHCKSIPSLHIAMSNFFISVNYSHISASTQDVHKSWLLVRHHFLKWIKIGQQFGAAKI